MLSAGRTAGALLLCGVPPSKTFSFEDRMDC